MPKLHRTPKGYTRTGLWNLIDQWIERFLVQKRRLERAEARKREEALARERIRRENQSASLEKRAKRADRSAAAFDRKMNERRPARPNGQKSAGKVR